MKKILLFILAINLLASCNKDFLDLKPLNLLSEDVVWQDEKLINTFVTAQYNAIPHGLDGGGDVAIYSDEVWFQANRGLGWEWATDAITADNVTSMSVSFNYWATAYSYINNMNVFFEKIESAPVEASSKNQMIAQMKFIRAFVYSRLLWNYGGVPIIDKVFNLSESFQGVTRNSYQEVLNYILSDLNDAIATLAAKQTGANAGRASGDAARALKARLLLYDASPLNNPTNDLTKWQAASDASAALLNSGYSLYPDYGKLFLIDGNSEIIFQRYFNASAGTPFNSWATTTGSNGRGWYTPTQNLVDAFEMTNGELPFLADGTVNPDSGYDPSNPYINRDPRFYATVLYNGAMFRNYAIEVYPGGRDLKPGNDASTLTGYYLRKFVDPAQPIALGNYGVNPWIFFRLGEVYLNYAEAQFQLGHEDVARTYVNLVRTRVGMPDITESGAELLVRIWHERQVELNYEGHRFRDVRRWKIAPQTESLPIMGTQAALVAPGKYTYKPVVVSKRNWSDKLYYLPIPRDEIIKSGNSLIQNPGWQ